MGHRHATFRFASSARCRLQQPRREQWTMGSGGMRASLVSRDWIADSVELVVRAQGYDGLLAIAGCDKSIPGMLMAMVRLDLPAVFAYGGSLAPGRAALEAN